MRRLAWTFSAVFAAAIFVACGSEQAVQFTDAEPPEPASVRLFLSVGEVTQHLPLNSGQTHRLEIRVFAANGARITGYDDHFEFTADFTPDFLAVAAPVVGKPLLMDVSTSAVPEELGTLQLSFHHAHTMTARAFGPFEVLVH